MLESWRTCRTVDEFKKLAKPGSEFSVGFQVIATVVARTEDGVLLHYSDEGDCVFMTWDDVKQAMEEVRQGRCAYYPVYIGSVDLQQETREMLLVRMRKGLLLLSKEELSAFEDEDYDVLGEYKITGVDGQITCLKWLISQVTLNAIRSRDGQ